MTALHGRAGSACGLGALPGVDCGVGTGDGRARGTAGSWVLPPIRNITRRGRAGTRKSQPAGLLASLSSAALSPSPRA
ncbi:MAG: hypothetical protein OSA47_08370, partial [Novosphingopyxis baekryungensis]|nr:hypothetical protein [Novosphingopyxis baekryungensis]